MRILKSGLLFLAMCIMQDAVISGEINKKQEVTSKINIKGIYIGMSKQEFFDKYSVESSGEFTIAGAPNKYPDTPLDPEFDEKDKLINFMFYFHPNFFEDVMLAVKNKYPKLSCIRSIESNAMGAKFQQIFCVIKDQSATLVIKRLSGDIHTSVIALTSNKYMIESSRKKLESVQKDL